MSTNDDPPNDSATEAAGSSSGSPFATALALSATSGKTAETDTPELPPIECLKPFVIEVVRKADLFEPAFGEWIFAAEKYKEAPVAEHAIKRMYDTDPLCRAVLVAFGFYKADGTLVKGTKATTNKFRDGCQHIAWYLCKAVEWAFESQSVQDSSGKTAFVVARGGNEKRKEQGKDTTEYTEKAAGGFGNAGITGEVMWGQCKPTPAFEKSDMENTKRLYHVKFKAPAQPSAMTPADAKALAEAVKVLVTEVVDANKLSGAITVAGNEKYSEYADTLQSLLDHAQTRLPRMQQIAAEDAAARSQGLTQDAKRQRIDGPSGSGGNAPGASTVARTSTGKAAVALWVPQGCLTEEHCTALSTLAPDALQADITYMSRLDETRLATKIGCLRSAPSAADACKMLTKWRNEFVKVLEKAGSVDEKRVADEYFKEEKRVDELEATLQNASIEELEGDPEDMDEPGLIRKAEKSHKALKKRGFTNLCTTLQTAIDHANKRVYDQWMQTEVIPEAQSWIAQLETAPRSIPWTKKTLDELWRLAPAFESLGKCHLLPEFLRDQDPVALWRLDRDRPWRSNDIPTYTYPAVQCRFDTVTGVRVIWMCSNLFIGLVGKDQWDKDITKRADKGELTVVQQQAPPWDDEHSEDAQGIEPHPAGATAFDEYMRAMEVCADADPSTYEAARQHAQCAKLDARGEISEGMLAQKFNAFCDTHCLARMDWHGEILMEDFLRERGLRKRFPVKSDICIMGIVVAHVETPTLPAPAQVKQITMAPPVAAAVESNEGAPSEAPITEAEADARYQAINKQAEEERRAKEVAAAAHMIDLAKGDSGAED